MVSFFGTCFFSILRRNVTLRFRVCTPFHSRETIYDSFFLLLKLEIFIDAYLPDEFIEM